MAVPRKVPKKPLQKNTMRPSVEPVQRPEEDIVEPTTPEPVQTLTAELEVLRNEGPIGITSVTGNWRCYIGEERLEKQIAVWLLMGDGTVVPGVQTGGAIAPATDVRAIKDPMGTETNSDFTN